MILFVLNLLLSPFDLIAQFNALLQILVRGRAVDNSLQKVGMLRNQFLGSLSLGLFAFVFYLLEVLIVYIFTAIIQSQCNP